MRLLLLALVLLAGCSRPEENPRSPDEVAPVQTRDTTLMRPSVPGGDSGPGLGTSEPDR